MLGDIFHKIFPDPTQADIDVEVILDRKTRHAGQPLCWRSSIVDLLEVLELDSSLQARKQLARELHYSGAMENPASMNVWLHRQVMNKLAQYGGKVPAGLKD